MSLVLLFFRFINGYYAEFPDKSSQKVMFFGKCSYSSMRVVVKSFMVCFDLDESPYPNHISIFAGGVHWTIVNNVIKQYGVFVSFHGIGMPFSLLFAGQM